MLDESEIRNWKNREIDYSECLIDDTEEKRICLVAIGILDGVLND